MIFNFIKSIFKGEPKADTSKECCGGSCQGKAVDLGISDEDRAALQVVADSVVVGKIKSIRPHSSEKVTKVQVTECDLGNGKVEQILCGGANIAPGQIVPVATLGTDLGEGFVIGERDIRGEVSRGMICARQEIGLTEIEAEKGGIWVLPAQLESKLGLPVNQL
jgi:phenylalanyl-tRNA synthetase beta chain